MCGVVKDQMKTVEERAEVKLGLKPRLDSMFGSLKFHPSPQPRPQGFSLKKWVGREKALASAGHVSPRTP